jgi:hypothetical protein
MDRHTQVANYIPKEWVVCSSSSYVEKAGMYFML